MKRCLMVAAAVFAVVFVVTGPVLADDRFGARLLGREEVPSISTIAQGFFYATLNDAGTQLTEAAFGAFFYNVVNEKGESYQLYTLSGVDPANFENFPMPRNTASSRSRLAVCSGVNSVMRCARRWRHCHSKSMAEAAQGTASALTQAANARSVNRDP